MAAVRLHRVRQAYAGVVGLTWKSYPLIVGERPAMPIPPPSAGARQRAEEEEPGHFSAWKPGVMYPSSSLPAQVAARSARLQGQEAFERYHGALFRAFFTECRDISRREVLLELAREAGLDPGRFEAGLDDGALEEAVLADLEEAREYEGWGIPLAIVGGRYPLAGAVPEQLYRRAIDLCLGKVH